MKCTNGLIVVMGLFFLATSSAAGQVIDDHFTGDSGGVPANWVRVSGLDTGSIVEAGTLVTITGTLADDAPTGLRSEPAFDLSLATSPIVATFTIDSFGGTDPEPRIRKVRARSALSWAKTSCSPP